MPQARWTACSYDLVMVDFNLYLITDRTQTAGRELPAVVADALAGGVRLVQLREKDLPARRQFELALQLRSITSAHGALLLINDRVDIAMAVGADGVHVGVDSLPVAEVRRLLGTKLLIGYSAHSVEEALQAERDGADFVTFGPVYQTPSKMKYGDPVGVQQLVAAVRALAIPVFALGGVKMSTVAEVMSSGCQGAAMISGIVSEPDPRNAASLMLEKIEKHATRR
ncbi:MAG: thiamine phosphate synthase [Geobacteraceae bacterium]|nr:thiamine phosphate synthase [Geobacteraceae bacterium]